MGRLRRPQLFWRPDGEAPDLFRSAWDPRRGMIMLNGSTPLNTNGGALAFALRPGEGNGF